jgi:predicted RNase H-like nuclease (RuvC/YqgF family)
LRELRGQVEVVLQNQEEEIKNLRREIQNLKKEVENLKVENEGLGKLAVAQAAWKMENWHGKWKAILWLPRSTVKR